MKNIKDDVLVARTLCLAGCQTRQQHSVRFCWEPKGTRENQKESGGTERKSSRSRSCQPRTGVYNSPVRAPRTTLVCARVPACVGVSCSLPTSPWPSVPSVVKFLSQVQP